MKHIKSYESSIKNKFTNYKKGDIIKQILNKDDYNDRELYLVLENGTSTKTDNWFGNAGKIDVINVLSIGKIGSPRNDYLNFYVSKYAISTSKIDNDETISFLTENEADLLYKEITKEYHNYKKSRYNYNEILNTLNTIKNISGINLLETTQYTEWLLKKDVDKYNL